MKTSLFLLTIFLAKALAMTIPQYAEMQKREDTCSKLRSNGQCSVDCPCPEGLCCSKFGFCGSSSYYCDNLMPTKSKSSEEAKTSTTKTKTSTKAKAATKAKVATKSKVSTKTQTTSKTKTTSTKTKETTKPSSVIKSSKKSKNSAGIVVYLPNYRIGTVINLSEFDFSNVDVVNFSFYHLQDDGEPYSYNPFADEESIKILNNDVKKRYPQLRTVLSFGGGAGSENFGSILSTEDKIDNAASKMAKFIKSKGFDGIDIDWEFPSDDTQLNNYAIFLKKIRQHIGNDKILTIAGSATVSNYKGYVKKYHEYLDWFNIMTYDYVGSWSGYSGYNSPLYKPSSNDLNAQISVDFTLKSYLDEGIPASKLVIGGAFYGRTWKVESSENNGFNQRGSVSGGEPGDYAGIWTYKALREEKILTSKKSPEKPWIRTWHSDVKSPTLFNPETKQYISYDDVESMCERMAYVKDKKIAGFMIWEIGQDYKRELLDSVIKCYHN